MVRRVLALVPIALLLLSAPAFADSTWERVSPAAVDSTAQPGLALDGSDVVIAWPTESGGATTSLQALRFRTSATDDVAPLGPVAAVLADATQIDPRAAVVVGATGTRVIFAGQRTDDIAETLKGTLTAVLNRDGSVGAPEVAASVGSAPLSAVSLADGTPLWVDNRSGAAIVLRGPFPAAPGADLQAGIGGCCAYSSVVGRDGLGALWTAWYSNSTGATGLYVAQLDPVTGVPLAPAQLVPGSTTQINDLRPGLACRPAAAGCRVVFSTGPITEPRLASWAPGEAVATPIVAGGARIGAPNARYAAAFRADGRLWVAWHEEGSARATGYYVALTDTSGRRGTATAVGAPPGSSIIDYDIQALPVGSDVLLVSVAGATSRAIWANLVTPDDPSVPDLTGIVNPKVKRNGPTTLVHPGTVSVKSIGRSKCVKVRVQSSVPARVGVAIFSGTKSIRVFGRTVVRFTVPGKRVVCIRVPLRAKTFDVRDKQRFAFAYQLGARPKAGEKPAKEVTRVFRFLK